MKIGNIDIGKVVLAPLAGYTNIVHRLIMKRAGAGLVYSEMISAKGLLYENDKTWDYTQINKEEHPISLQLFGGNAKDLSDAAKLLDERTTCDIIDINMGCPVKKVLKANSGSYLLQDIINVEKIVSEVVESVNKPVTVKIRAGWDHNHINCDKIAKACERAGASAIAIHGRTKSDLYRGSVNLDYIKLVKDSVSLPVIGNGDIKTLDDAIKMFDYTGVDAIMIGRASFGNPWLFTEINAYLNNKPFEAPSNSEKVEMMLEHLKMMIEHKGEKIGIMEMRSIASHYVKGFSNAKEFRQLLRGVKTYKEFEEIVKILI